jgi:diguanylate cyclase (GGDEF)-like protein
MERELMVFLNIMLVPVVGLTVILIDYYIRRPADMLQKRFFTLMISLALAAILSDIAYAVVVNVQGSFFVSVNFAANAFYFLFKTLSFSFVVLLYEHIFMGRSVRLKKLMILVAAVNIINAALLAVNLFTRNMFYITDDNIYTRGELYPLLVATYFLIMMFMYINIFRNRKNITLSLFVLALVSTVPSVVGYSFDIIFFGDLRITWPCYFISLLFCYLFIIRRTSLIDSLTNVYNRRGFDERMQAITKSSNHKEHAVIMIDLDKFKLINDNLGHAQGDNALRDAAELLRKSVRRSDFVARYGGDEFVIIAACADVDTIIKSVFNKLDEFNAKNIRPYKIALSCGGDIFRQDDERTPSEFLSHIDSLMYAEKERRKQNNTNPGKDPVAVSFTMEI